MTDHSQLVKRLREDVFYGDERLRKMHLHNPLHMKAADAIDALQARVAELEALAYLADAALMQSHGCFPLDRNTDEQRFLNDVASALRAVTGKDYYERKARAADAVRALRERGAA